MVHRKRYSHYNLNSSPAVYLLEIRGTCIRHTRDGHFCTVKASLQLRLMGNALDMTGACVRPNLDSA